MGWLSGFGVTLRQIGRPKVTEHFPKEKRPKPERFHGRHVLNRYEDGMEKCIGCELCAGVCPAKCIYVRGADNPPDAPVSPGERYGFVYEINYLRCIHCDLCVEACPTEAITETKLFEFSFANREDAIYTKSELLVDDDGRARRQPWELWLGGEDDHTSAWMRATAPSGPGRLRGSRRVVGRARLRRACPRGRSVGRRGRERVHRGRARGTGRTVDTDHARHGATPPSTPPTTLAGTDRWRRSSSSSSARSTLAGALRRRAGAQPGALRALARRHAGQRRGAVHPAGRPAARRGAGDRLRRRHRRAVPVRDHAARRRPARHAAATRCKAQRLAAIVLGLVLRRRGPLPHRPPVGHRRQGPGHRRDPRRHPGPRQQRRARRRGSLFTDFLWPFEITAALLVLAVIGAVVLAAAQPQRRRGAGARTCA